ncbi:MAG: AI-2E family transporter [bacterium]
MLLAPLLSVIVLTIIFGVLIDPIYDFLHRKFGATSAILATIVSITLVVIAVALFVVMQIVGEVGNLLASIKSGAIVPSTIISLLQGKIDTLIPIAHINILSSLESSITWFINQFQSIFASALSVVLTIFFTLVSLFYWFKDSSKLKLAFLEIVPLSKDDAGEILDSLSLSVYSLIRGTLFVVILQGILAYIGFVVFRVPNAILWGSVTMFCALVPTFGIALIFVPVTAYLFFFGHTAGAIGVVIWGTITVGLVDNLLGPRLMSRGSNLHPLFTLFGVVGGLELLGPIGVFAGPLIISLFFAICKLYLSHKEKAVE